MNNLREDMGFYKSIGKIDDRIGYQLSQFVYQDTDYKN